MPDRGATGGFGPALGAPARRAAAAFVAACLAASLGAGPAVAGVAPPARAGRPPNVLVLLVDDLGLEFLGLYDDVNVLRSGVADERPWVYPRTPTLERLAAAGVRFTQARVMPSCAATRASILGGRYPFRHGVGSLVRRTEGLGTEPRTVEFGIGPGNREVTLAHLARAAGLRSFQAGKWHLALKETNTALGGAPGASWQHVVEVGGFDEHWTVFGNLNERRGGDPWLEFEVGAGGPTTLEVEASEDRYATSAQVDRILGWTAERRGEPWFVYSAFNAVHAPFQLPPGELVATERYVEQVAEDARSPESARHSDWPVWCAMIEALDAELGRLLDGLAERGELDRTVVFFLGDNGSPEQVMKDAWYEERLELGEDFGRLVERRAERFKHTVWECGVRVPLIVSGPVVVDPGRSSRALVDAVDLWETIRELLDVERGAVLPDGHTVDGVGFLEVLGSDKARGARRFSLVEHFDPGGNPELLADGDAGVLRRGFVVETDAGRFKLVRNLGGPGAQRDRLFLLADAAGEAVDPWEQDPLETGRGGPHRGRLRELQAELEQLVRTETRNWGD